MDANINLTLVVSPDLDCQKDTSEIPDLISDAVCHVFVYVASLLTICVVCVFGLVSNVINVIIFYKQGLDNTTNIGFFSLAISDIGSLLTLQWTAIFMVPSIVNSGIPFDFTAVQYLTSSWPHLCFGNMTCWITAYITAERCLCIAIPLKVKQVITPSRTITIMVLLYIINIFSLLPEFAYAYIDWEFFPCTNKTLLTLKHREAAQSMKGVSFILLAILGSLPFPAVVLFTIILVVQLHRQAKWRNRTTIDFSQTGNLSKRDLNTMNTVALIAILLIVCYTPGIVTSTATFVLPAYNLLGPYVNTYLVTWGVAMIAHGINSSANIFLYYKLSSRFKDSFMQLFAWTRACGKVQNQSQPSGNTKD